MRFFLLLIIILLTENIILGNSDSKFAEGDYIPQLASKSVFEDDIAWKAEEEKEESKKSEYEEISIDPHKLLEFKLPLETNLSINGHKLIEFKLGNSHYLYKKGRDYKPAASGWEINQETSLKLSGTIRERIHVNIDYQEGKGPEKKEFSLYYKGRPEDTLQNISFGDLTADIPSTMFIKYSQSGLFGIKTNINHKKLNTTLIFARKSGIKTKKTFPPGKKQEDTTIYKDINYKANRYFTLEDFQNIEKNTLEIYIAHKEYQPLYQNEYVTLNGVDYMGSVSFVYQNCIKLQDFKDYIYDDKNRIIKFKKEIEKADVILCGFKYEGGRYGGGGSYLVVKKDQTEAGYWQEPYERFNLKNYYHLPKGAEIQLSIIDDLGKSYFDYNQDNIKNENEYSYLYIFGLDNDRNDVVDSGLIEQEDMINLLCFRDKTPFLLNNSSELENNILNTLSKIYGTSTDALAERLSNKECYNLPEKNIKPKYRLEVKVYQPLDEYYIGPFEIIRNSEIVRVGDLVKERDKDYTIDYNFGYIFFKEGVVGLNDKVEVEYEYKPIIEFQQKNLLGLISDYKLTDGISAKFAYLKESFPKPQSVPSIHYAQYQTLDIADISTDINFNELSKNLFKKQLPFSLNLHTEVARNKSSPNSFGYAMIDNMEGTKDERGLSLSEDIWYLGSRTSTDYKRAKILYKNEPYSKRPGPYNQEEDIKGEKDKENILVVDLEGVRGTATALTYLLSKTGEDISDYFYLEVMLKAGWQDILDDILIDIGQVSEDADGDGILDTEDKNNDRLLDSDEDIGFEFNDGDITYQGYNNSRLDTEDLNSNNRLDKEENFYCISLKDKTFYKNDRNWLIYNIFIMDEERLEKVGLPDLHSVKHIRIRFIGKATETRGKVYFGQIAFIKPSWEVIPKGDPNFEVSAKNLYDHPEYKPLWKDYKDYYTELYPLTEYKIEQALSIKYSTPSSGYIYKKYYEPISFLNYKYMRFFLYRKGTSSAKVLFSFGLTENDYYIYEYNLEGLPSDKWQLKEINLYDIPTENIRGKPTLDKISYLKMSVLNGEGEFWVNELHLAEPIIVDASASRIDLNGGYKFIKNCKYSQEVKYRGFDNTTEFLDKNSKSYNLTVDIKDLLNLLNINELGFLSGFMITDKIKNLSYTYKKSILTEKPSNKSLYYKKVIDLDYGTTTSYSHNFAAGVDFKDFSFVSNYDMSNIDEDKTKTNQVHEKNSFSATSEFKYDKSKNLKLKKLKCSYTSTDDKTWYRYKRGEDKGKLDKTYSSELSIISKPLFFMDKIKKLMILANLSNELSLSISKSYGKDRIGTVADSMYKPRSSEAKLDISNISLKIEPFSLRCDINTSLKEIYQSDLGQMPRVKDIASAARLEKTINLMSPSTLNNILNERLNLKKLRLNINKLEAKFISQLTANYEDIDTSFSLGEVVDMIYRDYYKGKLLNLEWAADNNLAVYRQKTENKRTYSLNIGSVYNNLVNIDFIFSYNREDIREKASKFLKNTTAYETSLKTELGKIIPNQLKDKVKEDSTVSVLHKYTTVDNITANIKEKTFEFLPTVFWNIPTKYPKLILTLNYSPKYKKHKKISTYNQESIERTTNISLEAKYNLDKDTYLILPMIGKSINLKRVVSVNAVMSYNSYLSMTDNIRKEHKGDYKVSVGSEQKLGENTVGNLSLLLRLHKSYKDKSEDFMEYSISYKIIFKF